MAHLFGAAKQPETATKSLASEHILDGRLFRRPFRRVFGALLLQNSNFDNATHCDSSPAIGSIDHSTQLPCKRTTFSKILEF